MLPGLDKLFRKRKQHSDTQRPDQPDKSMKWSPSSQLTTATSGGTDTASTSAVFQQHGDRVADSNQCPTTLGGSSEMGSMVPEAAASAEGNAVTCGVGQTPGNTPTANVFSLPGFQESLNEVDKDKGTNTLFAETLALYNDYQLHRLTKFYRDRLEPAIEEGVEAISSWLIQKECISPQEHKTLTELTHKGKRRQSSKQLLNLVMGKDSQAQRVLWEYFVKMRPNFPKLNKIMTEIQEQGASLVTAVMVSQSVPEVPSDLIAAQRLHKETLQKQCEKLEVNTILMKEKVKSFQLADRYTELTIISDLRHRELVEHELLARGRDHEEWRQKQLRGKLEKIRTDKLFHSSFSSGRHFASSQQSNPAPPTGTSAVVSGVAGIGKTTMVQKIVHDWATDKIYPHFHFVFVFKFRDLNRLHSRTTLSSLIVEQYPYLRDVLDELWKHPETLLFIFDGLDEFRTKIDFSDNRRDTEPQHRCTDPEFLCDVSDIMYSLFQKKLLPGCSVLVTSRPTALQLLAKAQVSVWAEILGFVGEERKQYFYKFFEDQEVAAAVYSHVEENQLLLTMCYNPSYCWILALSLGPFFTGKHSHKQQVPKTITQLFSYYIYHILTHHSVKTQSPSDVMLKIGEMAFIGVSQRNIVFSNEDLIKSNLQPSQFLSGFLMELVEREFSEHSVVYTFPHLTVQEFVAALAQFLSPHRRTIRRCLDVADTEEDGRFEIFLRFVAGLTSPWSAHPLEEFLGPFVRQTTCAVIDWLKEKVTAQIRDTDTVTGKRKLLNTLHYLFESQNQALAQLTLGSVQSLPLGGSSKDKALRLTPIDCVVLSQVIGLCDTIKLLDLSYCHIQDEGLQRLAPVLHKCEVLGLEHNNLGDSGVKRLCEALRNPECKIQRLWLDSNMLTHACTNDLFRTLTTSRSLRELHLGGNALGDSGVKRLFEALRNPECKIHTLGLGTDSLTADCAEDLISTLSTSRSLTQLDLGYITLGDSGVKQLCEALRNPECKIQIQRLEHNNLGDSGVKSLCEALRNPECKIQTLGLGTDRLTADCAEDLISTLSTSRSLTQLALGDIKLGYSGVKRLCEALRKQECKIQIQRLEGDKLGDAGVKLLCEALRNPECKIQTLGLEGNNLGDSGVKSLCEALRNPECKIQILWLDRNSLTDGCTDDLVSALSTSRSLRGLHLGCNSFTDASVPALRRFSLTCTGLERIWLGGNLFSSDGQRQLRSLEASRAGLTVGV